VILNKNLRIKIIEMISRAKEGHIPSSFSILDIVHFLYAKLLKFKKNLPNWEKRDYFFLSKGHGCAALYAVLHKFGVLKSKDILAYSSSKGILGGHPDCTVVPGVEASTGSLGHGFPTAVGLGLGLKIQKKNNKIFVLVGDGECQEGTIWETANIATNQNLGNICVIVDWNGSAKQLMPIDDLVNKWKAFGWTTLTTDGHSEKELSKTFKKVKFNLHGVPTVILAKTTKGKGVSFIQGHGNWHHKIPSEDEKIKMIKELKS
jgi:transketolase